MSNAKTSQSEDCEPCSRSPSSTLEVLSDGATATPSASSTRSSTPSSSAQAANSGTPHPDRTQTENGTLAERIAAPEYLDQIGGVAERIACASGQAAVQSLLSDGLAALGAENAIFVSFMRENLRVSSCRFMLACDPAWCRQYLDAGLIASDPWLAYASHHSEPVIASSLKVLEPERLRAIELATRNGFASAVLVPVHSGSSHTRVSLLCLGSRQEGQFEGIPFGRLKLGARVLACELHEWWVAHLRNELMARARITEDDLELLRHQCLGHSSKRIAAELRVSRSSINSRFQRMNNRLGVANRRMAARLAAECGLILP
ncbi:response regulator containing a CheY-like receiver domain and an HTH DNA-binding domain [Burkholderiales bacterium JOSHI_001]|nr:response regulator containing a CheY-like receiver domain and an HTH DNA-binding domain [Burkholderiales bacterium JOSHI_001]